MLAYVIARTRVKGVNNKEVYYVGTVQDDGYIYFNDDVSYRVPTPDPFNDKQRVNVSDVQVWYTVRNCWVRANYFTSLAVYAFQPDTINSAIDNNSSRVDAVERSISTINTSIGNLDTRVGAVERSISTINTSIGNLDTRVTNLDTALSNAVSTINAGVDTLGQRALGDDPLYGYGNGDTLLVLYNKIRECISWMQAQGSTVAQLQTRRIWTEW